MDNARGESRTRTRLPSADFEFPSPVRPRDTSGITLRSGNGLRRGRSTDDCGWYPVVWGTAGGQLIKFHGMDRSLRPEGKRG